MKLTFREPQHFGDPIIRYTVKRISKLKFMTGNAIPIMLGSAESQAIDMTVDSGEMIQIKDERGDVILEIEP
jgi:hypothetical protein